ncbi:MAG: hypothetical protein IAG10_19895 [Planctomycetaceae bacterium]|nr:hypothetical protein [Planctomycetaceae bacterium]
MSDLFPLPLAPFEEYLLLDDRAGYRMTFLVEQSFDGEIDRAAFDVGVAEASRRHPLLNAVAQHRRFRGWRWTSAGDVPPVINWASMDQPLTFPEEMGIDLTQEKGVRFFVRVGNGQSRLVTQFHHACCDGMGAIQYLSDVFAAYTRELYPHAAKHPAYQPVEALHLLRRGDLKVHQDKTMSRFRLFLRLLSYARHYAAHPPMALASSRNSSAVGTPLSYPGTLTRTFSPSMQHDLRRVARRSDVTVNEILVRELMLTIRDWNQRHSTISDSDQISIRVPTNLRNLDHDHMPSANLVGLVAFQRSVAELNQPEKLLESIKAESQFYKRWKFGAAFLDGLKVVRWIPGALRRIVNSNHSFGSAILSCIGDPSLAISANFPVNEDGNPILGNLVFNDLNTAPPIRPQTHASFTTWHFSNKMRLGVRCDSEIFTQESAQELLDLFADRVINVANSVTQRRDAARVAA